MEQVERNFEYSKISLNESNGNNSYAYQVINENLSQGSNSQIIFDDNVNNDSQIRKISKQLSQNYEEIMSTSQEIQQQQQQQQNNSNLKLQKNKSQLREQRINRRSISYDSDNIQIIQNEDLNMKGIDKMQISDIIEDQQRQFKIQDGQNQDVQSEHNSANDEENNQNGVKQLDTYENDENHFPQHIQEQYNIHGQTKDFKELMVSYFEKSVFEETRKECIKCQINQPTLVNKNWYTRGFYQFEIKSQIYQMSRKKKHSNKENNITNNQNNNHQQILSPQKQPQYESPEKSQQNYQNQQQDTSFSSNSSKFHKINGGNWSQRELAMEKLKQLKKEDSQEFDEYECKEVSVTRRYRDFDFLQQYFNTVYVGNIIYQLPEKNKYFQLLLGVKSEQDFLRERIEGLKTFLNENGNNQIITRDPLFRKFINYDGGNAVESDDLCKEIQSQIQSKRIYGLHYSNLSKKAQEYVKDQVNKILNFGFVEYMEDYDTILDINTMDVFYKIEGHKNLIDKYLSQLDKLEQNVWRGKSIVEDLRKNIDKSEDEIKQKRRRKKSGNFINEIDDIQYDNYIELNKKSQVYQSQEKSYDELYKQIMKPKELLNSAKLAYENHLDSIKYQGTQYKQDLDKFRNQTDDQLTENQVDNAENKQQNNDDSYISQNQQENIKWEQVKKVMETLQKGKQDIEKKAHHFEQELGKVVKVQIVKEMEQLYKMYAKILIENAILFHDSFEANTENENYINSQGSLGDLEINNNNDINNNNSFSQQQHQPLNQNSNQNEQQQQQNQEEEEAIQDLGKQGNE